MIAAMVIVEFPIRGRGARRITPSPAAGRDDDLVPLGPLPH